MNSVGCLGFLVTKSCKIVNNSDNISGQWQKLRENLKGCKSLDPKLDLKLGGANV